MSRGRWPQATAGDAGLNARPASRLGSRFERDGSTGAEGTSAKPRPLCGPRTRPACLPLLRNVLDAGLNGTGPRVPEAPRQSRGRYAARGPVPLASQLRRTAARRACLPMLQHRQNVADTHGLPASPRRACLPTPRHHRPSRFSLASRIDNLSRRCSFVHVSGGLFCLPNASRAFWKGIIMP